MPERRKAIGQLSSGELAYHGGRGGSGDVFRCNLVVASKKDDGLSS